MLCSYFTLISYKDWPIPDFLPPPAQPAMQAVWPIICGQLVRSSIELVDASLGYAVSIATDRLAKVRCIVACVEGRGGEIENDVLAGSRVF